MTSPISRNAGHESGPSSLSTTFLFRSGRRTDIQRWERRFMLNSFFFESAMGDLGGEIGMRDRRVSLPIVFWLESVDRDFALGDWGGEIGFLESPFKTTEG
jgi:hypothetical protein